MAAAQLWEESLQWMETYLGLAHEWKAHTFTMVMRIGDGYASQNEQNYNNTQFL